jgi:hypothetical protein
MSERICGQILKEYRVRQRRRRLIEVAALAACLVVAVGFLNWSRPAKVVENPNPLGAEVASPSLKESLQEAGAAVVSLTRRTADETLENTKLLLPAPDSAGKHRAEDPSFEGPVQSLRMVEEGVAAGIEPVALSARRAVNLFVREVSRPDERPIPR